MIVLATQLSFGSVMGGIAALVIVGGTLTGYLVWMIGGTGGRDDRRSR